MEDSKKGLTIGDVARRAGVSVETVRFYQRSGLVGVPEQFGTSRRRYSEGMVAQVKFFQRLQELGFSLTAAGGFLTMGPDAAVSNLPHVRSAAEAALAEVDGKIRDLEKIKGVLHEVIGASKPPPHTSPVLQALYPNASEETDGTGESTE